MIDPERRDAPTHLSALEAILHTSKPALDAARAELRMWLFSQLREDSVGRSIGDALLILSRLHSGSATAASVILRALSIPDLLPISNEANHIMRSCVEL